MRRERVAGVVAFLLVLSMLLPVLFVSGNSHSGNNSYPVLVKADSSNSTANGSYVRLTHIIPTNETYYGFHQVGQSSGGLTSYLLSTGTFSPNGKTFYVASGLMAISEVNTTDWYTIRTFNIPKSTPAKNSTQQVESISNFVFDPSTGLIYATVVDRQYIPYGLLDLSYLYAINPVNGSIVNTISLQNFASGLSYDQNNGMIYAYSAKWDFGGSLNPTESYLNEINPSNMTIVWEKQISCLDLKQMVFNAARNQLYIPDFNSGRLVVFNTTTDQIANVSVAGGNPTYAPTYVTYSADDIYVAYVDSQNISVVDAKTLKFAYNISLPGYVSATSVAYNPGISALYISGMSGEILQIDAETGSTSSVISTGTTTQALIFNNQRQQMFAVGYGKQAYFSVLGVGPIHQITFKSMSMLGPKQWYLVANGMQYEAVNGTVSFFTASNVTQYYTWTYTPVIVLPFAGTISGNTNAQVTLVFVNFFLVISVVSALTSIVLVRRYIAKKRKS